MVVTQLLAWLAFPLAAAPSHGDALEQRQRRAQCIGTVRPVEWGAGAPFRVARTVAGRLLGHTMPTPKFDGRGADVARFELAFALMRARPDTRRPLMMAAVLNKARAIAQENRRHQALIAGMRWLHSVGAAAESQRWLNAMTLPDHVHEARAHVAVFDALRGDLNSAGVRLRKLPTLWSHYVRPSGWTGYPEALGSQGAAVCAMMASPRVSTAPDARELVMAAFRSLDGAKRDWRTDVAWRGLALAASFVGDEALALNAAARIGNGSSRAGSVAAIVARAGKDSKKPLGAIARAASVVVSAPTQAPIVISEQELDLTDFVAGANRAELALGLARAWLVRGDAEKVRQVTAAIPRRYTAAMRGEAIVRCARLRAGTSGPKSPNLAALAPHRRHDWLVPLAQSGCVDDALAALKTAPMQANHLTRFVEQLARADVAAAGRYVLGELGGTPGPWVWRRIAVVCQELVHLGRPLDAGQYLLEAHDSGAAVSWRPLRSLAAHLAVLAYQAGGMSIARRLHDWPSTTR